jgi:glucose-6-phosphate 1-dehydrogenase
MEPPISFHADEIRGEKAKALRALRELDQESLTTGVVLGQYDGYRQERDVPEGSRTPTFAAMRLFIDNWRWQGVPFYLRAGKALSKRATEVKIVFQSIPLSLFGKSAGDLIKPNVLTLRIQPDEGIGLSFASKVPGVDFNMANVAMDFRYSQVFDKKSPEAYERLLLDAMRGDATLFPRRDEIEQAWRFVDPILRSSEDLPVCGYAKGSDGPAEAAWLIEKDWRRWESL